MKPHQRSDLVLKKFREVADRFTGTHYQLLQSINVLLHPKDYISHSTLMSWLRPEFSASIKSESAFALQEWIQSQKP